MKRTVKLIMTEEQAEWLREGLGEIRMATMQSAMPAQMVHYTYWKLKQAKEGREVPPVKLDVGGATIDLTDVRL